MTDNAIKLTIYSKPDCPLCDKALRLLDIVSVHTPVDVQRVNILSDSHLYKQYADRIPVLERSDGATLDPPIHRERLMRFIRDRKSDGTGSRITRATMKENRQS